MSTVIMHNVVSVDGFIADANDQAGPGRAAGGQALALGLVDEVGMDVGPVVFGSGKRYFGPVDTQHLLEDPHTVIQGNRCCTCATESTASCAAPGYGTVNW